MVVPRTRRLAYDVICARSVWPWTCCFLSVRMRVSTRMLQLGLWLLSFLAVVALMTPEGWRLFSSLHLNRFDVQIGLQRHGGGVSLDK